MSYQKLINTSMVPPMKFSFTVPENGYKIENQMNLEDLYKKVQAHYNDNGIPLPSDWKDRVEDQICRRLPAGWCKYSGDGSVKGFTPLLTAEAILKGLKSLASMALNAAKGEEVYVSQEEAERRANICSRCYFNMQSNFCGGCAAGQAITSLVSKVKGSRTTSYDNQLQACGICGCRNSAIVHVNRNMLLNGEKNETTNSRPDWCWVKNPDTIQADSLLKI